MAPSGPIIWAEGEGKIVADVIFVHGLRGDAVKTWSKDNICWPRDFLKNDLKNARIVSWGYDSSVLKPIKSSSQASIFGHVENLLNDVCRIRDSLEAEIRPIIFVGHSLGGLVIKEALIRASEYLSNNQHVDLGAIYSCTKGVVFLGTPHRGSGKAGIAEVISNIVKIGLQNPNDKLIEVLSEDSQILERQMKSFTSVSNAMPIACVTEEIATGIGMVCQACLMQDI
jgi:pimeloyl-ACP methyl ester carboxylesterase